MSRKEPILPVAAKPPDALTRRADLVRIRAIARRPEPLESPHGAASGHAFGHPVPMAKSCQDIVDEDAYMCRLEARLGVRSVRGASFEHATLVFAAMLEPRAAIGNSRLPSLRGGPAVLRCNHARRSVGEHGKIRQPLSRNAGLFDR